MRDEPRRRRVGGLAAAGVAAGVLLVGLPGHASAAPSDPVAAARARVQRAAQVVAKADLDLYVRRGELRMARAALVAKTERVGDVGRQVFVGGAAKPAGVVPMGGWISEFGIDAAQRQARELAEADEDRRVEQARVVASGAAVRRSEAQLAAGRRVLAAEQARLAALERAAAERARAAAAAYEAGRAGSSARFRGGRLAQPVAGPFSSPFGTRLDPYYHVVQLHAGLDIAAGEGAPLRAAASGWVLRAGENGGYGNYTCIGHGVVDGARLTTCYGHQSKILVRAGQHVARGQLIGLVGATGAATGPHLHFEVRLDGRPVDPVPWLSGAPIR